jgi:hypothetical protein
MKNYEVNAFLNTSTLLFKDFPFVKKGLKREMSNR